MYCMFKKTDESMIRSQEIDNFYYVIICIIIFLIKQNAGIERTPKKQNREREYAIE